MDRFLSLNPLVSRQALFVDDSENFEAYTKAGFGKIGEGAAPPGGAPKLKAPQLGGPQGWWRYLTNVAALSPVPAGLKFGQVPEGVLRLGGTFVIDGDKVLYAHADSFPGDHPAIADVLRASRIEIRDASGAAV
mmetsp:Transcript_32126/g.108146  ORF Transcript_32126/g.108146 Transcript_32126/m.108146 type:complete len:134 (+) Transcript_32126:463-864(+)